MDAKKQEEKEGGSSLVLLSFPDPKAYTTFMEEKDGEEED